MVTMETMQIQQRIFRLMARLLEYPREDLSGIAASCMDLLVPVSLEAAAALADFQTFIAETPLGRPQEVYTITFDLDAVCHPYVGHHIFGETYKRSSFMLGLKERYARCGLEMGSEVADHLALLVRFLSLCDDAAETDVIVRDALLPSLKQMLKEKDEVETEQEKLEAGKVKKPRVYQSALIALRHVLEDVYVMQTAVSAPVPA